MSMTDPIADMLTRIRNGTRVGKPSVDIPGSKAKQAVLGVLKREGYISEYKVEVEEDGRSMIRAYLKYGRLGEPVIQVIQRESTPGRRVYCDVSKLEPVLRGLGIAVVSTSKGVLSDRECRKEHVGGEVLCKVW
jgi:small subunit ribosomal protein S8